MTPQRQCIFRILHATGCHPTAHAVFESVHEEMPTVSLRTVYQTLNDLVALGEIHKFDMGTGAARFDLTTAAHHHLVCSRCGAMRDVHCDLAGLSLPERQHRGFTISGTDIVFRGLCVQCSQATSHEEEPSREKENRHV